MKELTIEHLAAYLPYEVKITGNTHGDVEILSSVSENAVNIKGRGTNYGMWADFDDIKLNLRPLSQLTETIEHNGERFIPIERLNKFKKLATGQHVKGMGFVNDYDGIIDREINSDLTFGGGGSWEGGYEPDIDSFQFYRLYKELHKWHFDTFGLIEDGLAEAIPSIDQWVSRSYSITQNSQSWKRP